MSITNPKAEQMTKLLECIRFIQERDESFTEEVDESLRILLAQLTQQGSDLSGWLGDSLQQMSSKLSNLRDLIDLTVDSRLTQMTQTLEVIVERLSSIEVRLNQVTLIDERLPEDKTRPIR